MLPISLFALALLASGYGPAQGQSEAATPTQLVEAYDSLADAILATKKTEWNLVHSILAMTYRHAEGALAGAKAKLKSGGDARDEVEKLAALVSQLGNEGDASVAAVRKRLLEGGHHHNAAAEQKGIYEEGYVIVTRKAKKAFLDSAIRIGKLAGSRDASGLDAEWQQVAQQFKALHEEARN
jgi:hypothetical protein